MTDESYVIGIDCGTQSSKAIVCDNEKIISEENCKLEIINPCQDIYEQKAEDWWKATCIAVRKAIKKIDDGKIKGIGITHQRETFVPISSDGVPLRNAILWMDKRPYIQVERVRDAIEKKIHKITGKMPYTFPSLYKILWLKDNEPQTIKKTYKFLDVHAFLSWHLTGKYLTSIASADSTSLLDIRKKEWSEDLIEYFQLNQDQFPDLTYPGQVVGEVTKEASEEIGLPKGIPVVAGGGDGQCATLGANIVKEGDTLLYFGTAALTSMYSSAYRVDVANRSFRTMCGLVPESYILESVLHSGAYLVSWFIENFMDATQRPTMNPEKMLESAASRVSPISEGLITIPYWLGLANPPNSLARGAVIGWIGHHSRAHFYRSILEGVAFEHRLLIEHMVNSLGTKLKRVIFAGGGSKSLLWGQIVSDVLGIPISISETPEVTALGAAILAASGIGMHSSIVEAANNMTRTIEKYQPSENLEIYEIVYERIYKRLFPAMQNIVEELSQIILKIPSASTEKRRY